MVAGIGNALMAMPMISALLSARDDVELTVVARTPAIGAPYQPMAPRVRVRVAQGSIAIARAIRAVNADVCLIPFPSNRWQYHLLAAGAGAAMTLIHAMPSGAFHLMPQRRNNRRVDAQPGLHDVEQNVRLLSGMGIESSTITPPRFELSEKDHARGRQLLDEARVSGPFIAVHPGSAATSLARAKRWPESSFAQLIRAISSRFDTQVVVIEGPDEPGTAQRIIRAAEVPSARALRLRGPLSDAAAVLQQASLYVGIDSGLGHLAAAVDTTPVTIFAPADPDRVCPYGYRHLVVQPRRRDCSPCMRYPWHATRPAHRCRPPYCVDDVAVEDVLAAMEGGLADELISSRRDRP